ncbi:hypothetical protein GO730_27460 [Spirosoma sp. HMF3257]|uniref:Uncharacterized protein n=1 Tax=Spirosoma telluris TaxID=2183553 RepID=A0A327NRB9_9BACT|nr:hypothetical protein [Spirosoma telluris]RAI76969.1 hypothetical protein HMF3257_27380 [Spirosoma telluris]
MSIQEMKSQLHQLIDNAGDEPSLERLLDSAKLILAGQPEHDILDDLTDEQLAGIEKAREEVRRGEGISIADFKRKMESKWPQLKSL